MRSENKVKKHKGCFSSRRAKSLIVIKCRDLMGIQPTATRHLMTLNDFSSALRHP
ncbi:MAG: hypothetical protein LBB23_01530 [Rickettsiales bacterium]|nr:hypothetical protein [Rickettsiales bacterium]